MEARPHPQQTERLAALHAYEVLDTEPEKDFDDIARLAAAICEVPIAVVNLIDEGRQWFKAETGLGVRETPLDTSLCSHAILEEDFTEIPDTLNDARMADNPLCGGDAGLRFYAGAQLRTDQGLPIGTLCVLDHAPRSLTPLQRDTLRVLARQVMAQLEMRKALRSARLLRREVDHRVKNSLQSLASFVQIQARQARGDETAQALDSVISRIDAVARLHEQLYIEDDGPFVDLATYVGNLESNFRIGAPANVALTFDVEPVRVSSRQAVAIGTLLNEFIANSIKHAFPDGRDGQVRVTIARVRGGNAVTVSCADDGIGLPSGENSVSGGLGMQIARVICAELQSELQIDTSSGGTRLSLVFTPEVPGGA